MCFIHRYAKYFTYRTYIIASLDAMATSTPSPFPQNSSFFKRLGSFFIHTFYHCEFKRTYLVVLYFFMFQTIMKSMNSSRQSLYASCPQNSKLLYSPLHLPKKSSPGYFILHFLMLQTIMKTMNSSKLPPKLQPPSL